MLLSVLTFLTIVSCYSGRLVPRDDEDFSDLQKQKADSPSKSFLLKRNLTSLRIKSTLMANITSTHTRQPKKWQVGRVTRKQYEMINLLWRKTKIFMNFEHSTSSPTKRKHDNFTKKIYDLIQGENPIIFTARPQILQSSTPSNIEFYYSDESGDYVEKKDCVHSKCQLNNNKNHNTNVISTSNSSFLVFHIKGPLLTRTTRNYYSTSQSPFNIPRSFNESTNKKIINAYKTIAEPTTKTNENTLDNKRSNYSTEIQKTKSSQHISDFTVTKYQTESTTVYDKIKFFELYDKHTRVPFAKKANMLEFDYNEKVDEEIDIKNVDKILLEHVDQSSHEHNEAKYSKKHIVDSNNSSQSCFNAIEENSKPKAYSFNITTERQNNKSSHVTNGSFVQSETKDSKNVYSYTNKLVSWSKYPFSAVYVYEPSQVHCDAASISAHWLVASGSCLSRMNQSPVLGDGRSAFVAYCGDSWWQPERVSYVKYSVVHPWYHPRERTRRHLYNIGYIHIGKYDENAPLVRTYCNSSRAESAGVIQVVTSMMSACSEWAPVSLMSHQYAANQGGSEALALGWGLDRYDTRYAALDLPKESLMIYKGLVFSVSCPGYIRYGKVKPFEGDGLKNVYCLSLPPYAGEERDPVHGSLLLVGGKLIALYLQEERRPWGEQSAQYTGIWHLIPWVVEVAREPEEMESFTVEI